ncbi:hypothetical protein LCGC14_2324000 [marine sediment metagenome]|uniref:Uncharacterized protein n=1 Tax=marine sediment metagenome TaxID=412755 RepID=A0A0F9CHI5_9ZZZZ
MISPKLLIHNNGRLHAYRGLNQIAYRFGGRVRVCEVKQVFGPIYRRISHDFFECIDRFVPYRGQSLKKGPFYEP